MKKLKELKCVHGKILIVAVNSPIGKINIAGCPKGIHAVGQQDQVTDENFSPDTRMDVETVGCSDDISTPIVQCIEWLKVYFQDSEEATFTTLPSLCFESSVLNTFRYNVWLCLANHVKSGCTISYGQLARLAGSPKAAQAVGSAMKANPFQILIPCHRVIKAQGDLGLYSGGCRNKVKGWLLQHEGYQIA